MTADDPLLVEGAASSDDPAHEDAAVMRLLDSILRDLDLLPDDEPALTTPPTAGSMAPPGPAVSPTPSAPTRPVPPAPAPTEVVRPAETRQPVAPPAVGRPVEEPAGIEGTPSPYLEERLDSALRAIAQVREEMRDMALRSQSVRETVGAVEVELGRSVRELEFLRAQHGRSPLPPAPLPGRTTRPNATGTRARPSSPAGRYAEFTVDRYNRTMTRVKARRRRMARWMVVLAALISVGLIGVDLAFPNPQPAWWLGILPAVWMIPVPFFALSFRGTQRVLRRNHFDLPSDG